MPDLVEARRPARRVEPLQRKNLVGWPRDVLPTKLMTEMLRGGAEIARLAGCHLAGGHSIDPEPKYGLAVIGLADLDRLLRNDAARAGQPISLTKPLGIGVLNIGTRPPARCFRKRSRPWSP